MARKQHVIRLVRAFHPDWRHRAQRDRHGLAAFGLALAGREPVLAAAQQLIKHDGGLVVARPGVTLVNARSIFKCCSRSLRARDKTCGDRQPTSRSTWKCSSIQSGNSALSNGEGSSTAPVAAGRPSRPSATGGAYTTLKW